MKILFATSECMPFVKTGGIADVMGALPREILKAGEDVRVILPLYKAISSEWREKMQHMLYFYINLGWRRQYVGIETMVYGGVTYYFVDNEQYFGRDYIYGMGGDEGERFAYFCRAVMEALPKIDFIPDVLHCNDWQTGLIPVLHKLQYKQLELFENIEEYSRKPIPYGAESYSLLSCLYGIMAVCLKTDSFAELSDKSRGSMRYVMELIDYINEHYREPLTAETLSRQMNLSPTYLYSLFRTYLGVTPLNYINSVRLREAYGLLEEGRSVTETASGVGIPNVSYFIKLFKSATGVTPFQWKSRKKQKTTQD